MHSKSPVLFVACMMPMAFGASTDITFFAVSDPHFGKAGAEFAANRTAVVATLNALPGRALPASVGGGIIRPPDGVLIAGDLVEHADLAEWADYIREFGLNGEGRLKWPVYDALGNHDGPGGSLAILGEARKRNARRAAIPSLEVGHADADHYHYSWDWGQVHFVNLNLFSGQKQAPGVIVANHDPFRSLEFLRKDLEAHVGKSGRPVFVMQHYAFDGSSLDPIWGTQGWWTAQDAEATYAVLRDYNVIGLLHGHSHGMKFYKWKGLDVFDNGTAMSGNVLVFRITDSRLFAAAMTKDEWVTLKLDKAIAPGNPVARGPGRPAGGAEREGLAFTREGSAEVLRQGGGIRRVEIRDLKGRRIRSLAVQGPSLHWDGRDERGDKVPPGAYHLAFRGPSARAVRALVLK